jgi:hypothetical protein
MCGTGLSPLNLAPPEFRTVLAGASTRWVAVLRTANLLEGFLAVPAAVGPAYPPAPPGAGRWEVVRGLWFETGERIWVWLDREANLLCGPDLAERLAWREAGERFEVTWAAEGLLFRPSGVDPEVQREETRLADVEALAGLRGGLGESYRQSVAAVLAGHPAGLTFRELVPAVRQRQGHEVHRGTLRAVLNAGGFVCREGRWQVGPDEGRSRRLLREAVVRAADRPPGEGEQASPHGRLREVASAVADRCRALRLALHSSATDRRTPPDPSSGDEE